MKTFRQAVEAKAVKQKDLNTVEYAPGEDATISKNRHKRRMDSVAGESYVPEATAGDGTARHKKLFRAGLINKAEYDKRMGHGTKPKGPRGTGSVTGNKISQDFIKRSIKHENESTDHLDKHNKMNEATKADRAGMAYHEKRAVRAAEKENVGTMSRADKEAWIDKHIADNGIPKGANSSAVYSGVMKVRPVKKAVAESTGHAGSKLTIRDGDKVTHVHKLDDKPAMHHIAQELRKSHSHLGDFEISNAARNLAAGKEHKKGSIHMSIGKSTAKVMEEVEITEATDTLKKISEKEYKKHIAAHHQFGHGVVVGTPKGTRQYRGAEHLDHDKKTNTHITQTYSHADHGIPSIERRHNKNTGEITYHKYVKSVKESVEIDEEKGDGSIRNKKLHKAGLISKAEYDRRMAPIWAKKKAAGSASQDFIKRSIERQKNESVEEIDEVLNVSQRIKRGRDLKKNKAKLMMGKRRQANRIADKDRLKDRAKRHARDAIVKRITKGISKGELSPQRRAEIERRLDRMKGRIEVISKKILPQIRKDEIAKKRGNHSGPKTATQQAQV